MRQPHCKNAVENVLEKIKNLNLTPLQLNQTSVALYTPSNHSASTPTLRLPVDSKAGTLAYGKDSPPEGPTNDLLPDQFLLCFFDRLSWNLDHHIWHIQTTIPDTSLTCRVDLYPIAPHRHHLHLQL